MAKPNAQRTWPLWLAIFGLLFGGLAGGFCLGHSAGYANGWNERAACDDTEDQIQRGITPAHESCFTGGERG